jgi:gas vesicle protein
MKTPKKNLITEINRIHQLMGVKKVILESRKILVPLLQVAQEIVEFAAKRNLDDATRRSVSELNSGFKGIVDAEGNRIPLTAEDYVKIFDNLKKSSDPAIVSKVAEMDKKIVSAIQDNISELITPEIKTLVKQYLDAGGNEDYVVREFQKIFRNTPYGKYADFVTVADDAGNVIETLLDDYLKEIRKVYGDLGGKLDDVITPVVDDTGGTADGAIAREILDLSPVFTRFTNQVGEEMKSLLDQVMERIEYRTSENLTPDDKLRIDEIDEEIKALMDEINDLNSNYVKNLENQIKYGMELGPKQDRGRWNTINKFVKGVKEKYGDWSVTKLTTPKSELWVWIDATTRSFFDSERNLFNFVTNLNPYKWPELLAKAKEKGKKAAGRADGIREELAAYEKKVNSDLAAKVVWWQKYLIPGSSRGRPTKLTQRPGTELYHPNAYGEILKYSTKNKMLKAWLSLVAEKIFLVAKTQLYYSVIMPFYQLLKLWSSSKEVQRKYKDCISETAVAIKNGNIKWDDYTIDSETTEQDYNKIISGFPECLQTLIKSKEFMDNEYEDFMTRANFWSRGTRGEILRSYFTDYLYQWGGYDFGRFFTGALGLLLIKYWTPVINEMWESEETGDLTEVEVWLNEQPEQMPKD